MNIAAHTLALAEQRDNARRCYELAVAMERLALLRGRYLEARKRRHGQRAAWVALRSHVCWMLQHGI